VLVEGCRLKVFGEQQPSTFKCSYKAVEPHKALVEIGKLLARSNFQPATFNLQPIL
jgi:hypothetical protein